MSEPPAWAQQLFGPLMASVQRLQEQQQHLQERFEALSLGDPVPPIPELLSADALQRLVSHPYLSDVDRLFARLLQHSARKTVSEEDTELFNQCYAELRGRVLAAQDAPADAFPSRDPAPAAPRSSPPGDQNLYVSRSGREYDTRQPPPYPCNRCNTMHWSNTPCPPRSHGYFQRNSRGGTSRPAQAPTPPAGRSQSSSR